MKVLLINRKNNSKEQSIEKLYNFIKPEFRKLNIDVSEMDNPYGFGILNMIRTIFYFRKHSKENIIHVTGQVNYAILLVRSDKVIITVHDLGLYRPLPRFRQWLFLLFWVYLPFRKAKIITVISEKTKEEIIKVMPSVLGKIRVIPNCLTSSISLKPNATQDNIRDILIVGTRSNKNLERSIKACSGLDVMLTIVGELTEDHRNLLIQYKVCFLNYIEISENELTEVYKKNQVLLFPSLYEGFGLPILEAQANDLFVITSEISPLIETAGNGAIFVNPYNVDSIREGINKVLEMGSEEKSKYLDNGKKNIDRFSVFNVALQYKKIYNELA